MYDSRATLQLSIGLALEPPAAFAVLVEELAAALARSGITFEPGPDGRVVEGEFEVGRVIDWQPGQQILLQWRPANWQPGETSEVALRLEPVEAGTRAVLEHRGWGGLTGSAEELAAWFAGEAAAPILRATAPAALGDWLTDRRTRRPSGAQARSVYRDPTYHYPNFRVILAELALTADDYLIEVGCGGGALLKQALRSGCRAAAVDHSPDMVRLAQDENRDAVAQGRLVIREASAGELPFPEATFTCAAMTGVLGFLPDPLAAFREIHRVLRPGGRFVALGADPALRGTPAAPEPIASRLHFYTDDELEALGHQAGFKDARVVRRDLEPFAREAGIPEAHLALFHGPGGPFLIART
jgi:SAM-dependent methyltransferase